MLWNPLTSGRTNFELLPFYRWQQIEGDDEDRDIKTNGWNSRCFAITGISSPIPRRAARSGLTLPGISAGLTVPIHGRWFRSNLINISPWGQRRPSGSGWLTLISGRPIHRPGMFRAPLTAKRSYPTARRPMPVSLWADCGGCGPFRPSASVIKPRFILCWNPVWPPNGIRSTIGLGCKNISVSIGCNLHRLSRLGGWPPAGMHTDMKWDAGLGLRLWAKGLVARIDTAVSAEGFGIAMMVSQPFQF